MLYSSQGLTIFELKLDKVGLYDTFDLDILDCVLPIFAWTANGHFAYTKKNPDPYQKSDQSEQVWKRDLDTWPRGRYEEK